MSLPRVPRTRPRPKLRAIPRRQTEAAVYAEIQQLAVEKQRLQQELTAMHERRQQIETRLQEIDQSVETLQGTAKHYAQLVHSASDPTPLVATKPAHLSAFHPLTIDY